MYVIIVYDVAQSRVGAVCRYLRRYLHWVQNSSFEGELSEGQLEELKHGVRKLLDLEEDSLYIYTIPDRKWCSRDVIGVEKKTIDTIL